MNTLLFTLEYPPFHGGVANYYGNLVKYWPQPDGIKILNNNQGSLINNKLPMLKWLPACFALRQKIKREKISHILVGHILPLGTAALICAKIYNLKYSVILHGLDLSSSLKEPRKKWLAEKILSRADKIICVNSFTADLMRQNFPELSLRLAVVNPGVEPLVAPSPKSAAKLRKKYNLDDKIILLSVGRLIKRKGFDKVIAAMPEILKQMPNLVYIIIGDGEELKNYELNNNIFIITQASDREKNLWYNLCDIFIMTSRNLAGDFEGFGIVYLEANLAGKPVIAGASGGVGDAVIDGLNGLLVDPENTNEIAAAIIKLAANPKLREKIGRRGKERAVNEFNWYKQINKIYQSIK